ncbi:class I SAM-dependent methyltransferase [Brucella intermedia]|uniref:class I SAM-dependent methyltransferase n=1 Tax=Brucella intermedia TaxID=94625 RepID=UPI00224AF282|nr:class I SAM-dependent methyltransferase [Brucella intermedia]
MREKFEQIYETDAWHGGSGPGSFPVHTKGYVRFLEQFLRNERIQSVVDLGCGDWQFSRFIDWNGARYDGFDLVRSVVDRNNNAFGTAKINFHVAQDDPVSLPSADLLIAKDVLQHWSDRAILDFLPHLQKYKFALITNCINPNGPTTHQDAGDGGFRYLDLRQPPYNLKADHVYTFTNFEWSRWKVFSKPEWRKYVLLFRHHQT